MGDISPHFSRWEFACGCGCGFDDVSEELIHNLELTRACFQKPIKITSACRCEQRNDITPGASPTSAHLPGTDGKCHAADFVVAGVNEDEVAEFLEAAFPMKHGIGRYDGRTHFDVRRRRARWDFRSCHSQ